MSDDGLVPAVDPKAANDPLLQSVVELGKLLNEVSYFLRLAANPVSCELDASQQSRLTDLIDEGFPLAISGLQDFQAQFSPKAEGLSDYPPDLPPLLHWLVGEAKTLIEQATKAIGKELAEVAHDLRSVAGRILLSGTNPTAACRAEPSDVHLQHELEWFRARTSHDDTKWPELHDWLYQKLQLFHKTFAKRIKTLNADEYVPEDSS